MAPTSCGIDNPFQDSVGCTTWCTDFGPAVDEAQQRASQYLTRHYVRRARSGWDVGALSVLDVAAYIATRFGEPVTLSRLSMLAYYCLAWHAYWDEGRLFYENFRATEKGIRCEGFAGLKVWSVEAADIPGRPSCVIGAARNSVEALVFEGRGFADAPGHALRAMAMSERPYLEARFRAQVGERPGDLILLPAMVAQCEATSM